MARFTSVKVAGGSTTGAGSSAAAGIAVGGSLATGAAGSRAFAGGGAGASLFEQATMQTMVIGNIQAARISLQPSSVPEYEPVSVDAE
jgi:hypothetical protein